MIESRAFRTWFLLLVLFTLLAGESWRYSISWYGFGAIAVFITVVSIAVLLRGKRDRTWRIGSLPYPLFAFLALATLSIAWSHYRGATALGLLVTWMTVVAAVATAIRYTWRELLDALAVALRIILGLSLLFELVVATFVRRPVLPLWVDYGKEADLPKLLYWSRNELFEVFDGGRIQGIVGNSSLLAFLALLGVVVFALKLAERKGRGSGWVWLAVAGATILFTRSATISVALVAIAVVVAAVLLVRRAQSSRDRAITYWYLAGFVATGVAIALVFGSQLLGVLGKSEDLTGRLGIWEKVIALAQERPAFGWGWVSYWVPWVDPFDHLVTRNGVLQLHAHNAWLDVWMQLGIVGLVVFGALVVSTVARAWLTATDRPQATPGKAGKYSVVSLLPILLLTALLVQSVAESRLLVEYGLFLLVIVAVKTRQQA
jgi:O-antigen ligase